MQNNFQGGIQASDLPKINPFSYPSEVCPNCGKEIFVPGMIFKKIPGVLVGQGAETVQVPIKVFVCANCGQLSPTDTELIEKAKKEEEQINKSNIII